jgi:hypothetical protein
MTNEFERYRVARPFSRSVVKFVLLPVMIGAFSLAVAWLVSPASAGRIGGFERLIALLLCGIALLILILGLVSELRRGRGPALEVDASGIRLAGMPWLAWPDVAELRAEEIVGFGGGAHHDDADNELRLGGGLRVGIGRRRTRTMQEALASGEARVFHRLGVVPRDKDLADVRGATGALARLSLKMRRQGLARTGDTAIELAPFGVFD